MIEAPAWGAKRTYVVVMTHSDDPDLKILRVLLDRETRYIGFAGSRTKWSRIKDKLKYRGVEEWEWEKVNCPIGGKSPREVAISLSARLLKDHCSRIARSASEDTTPGQRRISEPIELATEESLFGGIVPC